MEQGEQKMLVLEYCAGQLTYVQRHNKITGENRYWAFCTEDEADLFIMMDNAEMNGMIYCDEDIIYEYSYVNEDEEAVLYD